MVQYRLFYYRMHARDTPMCSRLALYAALIDGRMLHTTKLIIPTTVENNNSWVYCFSRVASNNESSFSALKILSSMAQCITVTGDATANRSKIGLSMAQHPSIQITF